MCSHFFHSGFGKILGDVVGTVAGFLVGGPVGAAIGGGLAGAGGSALGGGNLGQDLLAGAAGAVGGYGGGVALGALGVPGDFLGSAIGGGADVGAGAAGTAAGAASDLGITGIAPIAPVTSTPLPDLAPALQPSAAAADIAAPTAVSEAPVIAGGPSAISAAPVATGAGTQADMASAIAAQQGLAGGGSNAVASLTGDTTTTAAPAADATAGGGTSLGDTVSNAYHSLVGFPQSDLVNPVTGQYTLPPPAPVTPGSPVVDPATGATLTPADPGYGQAVASVQTPAAVSPPASAPQSTSDSIMSSPVTKLAGAAASGLGLLRSVGQSNQANPIPGMAQVQQIAQQSATQGGILQSYLTTGTLPPAVQASVDQATQDGITAIKSKYASMGIAPNSTAEAQDIAHLKQNAVVQGATLADQLTQQGISLTELSAQLYNDLVGYNQTLNTQTGQAISNLATALAGGGNTLTLNSNNQLVRAA